jgi:hypothetical protein
MRLFFVVGDAPVDTVAVADTLAAPLILSTADNSGPLHCGRTMVLVSPRVCANTRSFDHRDHHRTYPHEKRPPPLARPPGRYTPHRAYQEFCPRNDR